MQGDRAGQPLMQQVVGQNQVGQQFPARVVGDQDHAGAWPERGPQAGAVIGDQPVRGLQAGRRADAEAQVGPVSPQRGQQLGLPLLAGRQALDTVKGREVRLQRGIAELRRLEVLERVHRAPWARPEEAGRVEEAPVKVRLRPQERRLEPGPAEKGGSPRGPGLVIVCVRAERAHHPRGDLLEQAVQRPSLNGPERMRVPDLGNQAGSPVVPHPPCEPGRVAVEQFRWLHSDMLWPGWRRASRCRLL